MTAIWFSLWPPGCRNPQKVSKYTPIEVPYQGVKDKEKVKEVQPLEAGAEAKGRERGARATNDDSQARHACRFCYTFYHVPPTSFTLIPTLLSPDRTRYVPRSSRPLSGYDLRGPEYTVVGSPQAPVRSRVPFSRPLHDHFHDLPNSSALYEEPRPPRSWASNLFYMKTFN